MKGVAPKSAAPSASASPLVMLARPRSPAAEAYRTLRTNLQFAGQDRAVRTVLVTSALAGEGKSTVLANLAVALSHAAAPILPIAKMRHIELRQRNADQIIPLPADHLAVGHVLPQVLAYFPANDLSEPRRVAVNFHHHRSD